MSMLNDGREVHCDGDGCTAQTGWVIGLHSVSRSERLREETADGWLSVSRNHCARHFCPLCAVSFLNSVSNDLLCEK